jgi:sugar transferase (PEP-CTERM system associated)
MATSVATHASESRKGWMRQCGVARDEDGSLDPGESKFHRRSQMVRMFSHWIPLNTLVHFVFDAVLLFLSVVLAALWLYQGQPPSVRLVVSSALLFAASMLIVNMALGLYQRDADRTRTQALGRVVLAWLVALPIAYGIFEGLPWGELAGDAFKLSALVALVIMLGASWHAVSAGSVPLLVRRVLILGTGDEAAHVDRSLKRIDGSARIVGFLRADTAEASRIPADRVLPEGVSLADAVRDRHVDEIIVAVRERRGIGLPLQDLLDCKLAGVRVLDLSSYFEQALGQVQLESLHASWLIFGQGFRLGPVRAVLKRSFDIVTALLMLLGTLPLMLLTAVLIVFESGFPILYRQERVGQNGRTFNVLKFRSMRVDAEGDGKPRWASSNDDRVTRVGRVIRKLRIDELPQLINVLMGDMSMVGPRPERPYFVERLAREIPFYGARHSVKPGVTGWAQVRYHYGASTEDAVQKLQFDLYYVKNHSLFFDLLILFKTVGVVLTGAGAQ